MAKAQDDMIRFRCHRCKKRIAAPLGHVGKKVKCPGCQIVTIVPDIPAAEQASQRSAPQRPAPPLTAPPPPVAAPPPMDDLSVLATATYDDGYDQYGQDYGYSQSGGYDYDDRPRGPKVRQSHLMWIGALGMALHVLWIGTLGYSIWKFVDFIISWNEFNSMASVSGVEMPTKLIVSGFLDFFLSLVFCFCCFTGAMACGMVRTMGRKMNTL